MKPFIDPAEAALLVIDMQNGFCHPDSGMGKSEIKRRYTVEHVFRAGNYRVALRLKKRDKMIASATVMIEVRPGIRDL